MDNKKRDSTKNINFSNNNLLNLDNLKKLTMS